VAEKTGFFLNGKLVEFDQTHKIFTNRRTSAPKITSREVRMSRIRFQQSSAT